MSFRLKKVLFIGMVWPESTSTAAGGRMISLIKRFSIEADQVHFACAALESARSDDLEELGCAIHNITLNSEEFNELLIQINPEVVIYDRFITEEQYGWRVADVCPSALRILDTEDLHFLRVAREESIKKYGDLSQVDVYSKTAKRELASILRCDLSLIISKAEIELLKNEFSVSSDILIYDPISFEKSSLAHMDELPSFDERKGFMTIGNFKHAPNSDAVRYTKTEIWPLIKKQLPDAEISVYGAYLDGKSSELSNPEQGFYIHGAVPSADDVFKKAKVCLTPLRFGAGLKGKLLRAAYNGTPSVSTSVGAEGIASAESWPGFIGDSPEILADAAVELYQNERLWNRASEKGLNLIDQRFTASSKDKLISTIKLTLSSLEEHRRKNFIGSILQFHTLRSTEFMSRWIAEKNKPKMI